MRNLFWLSDEQWKRIEPHLPTDVRGCRASGRWRQRISGMVHIVEKRLPLVRLPARIRSSNNNL